MAVQPENKALKDCQRLFVHKMVYEGFNRVEAYVETHDIDMSQHSIENIRSRASNLFYKPNVNKYYHAILEEMREKEMEKGIWTREVATQKLLKLIEKSEQDIYNDNKALTMARLNAIVLPAKELNLMNGFNQTNLSVDGAIVQIFGESEIPE